MRNAPQNRVKDAPLPAEMLPSQRSHILCLQLNSALDQDAEFEAWFEHLLSVIHSGFDGVIRGTHYKRDNHYLWAKTIPCRFRYLGLYDLSLDGAQSASASLGFLEKSLHSAPPVAEFDLWLYYGASEKVGRDPNTADTMLTLALANAVPEKVEEFNEWYTTEHIRHALHMPTIVSGQRFIRSCVSNSSLTRCDYESLALYEHEGSIEDIKRLAPGVDPSLIPISDSIDLTRFAEWTFKTLHTMEGDDE